MRANVLLQNIDGQSIDVSSPFLIPSLQFAFVGRDVGLSLGRDVGPNVGAGVGFAVGLFVGERLGAAVGHAGVMVRSTRHGL